MKVLFILNHAPHYREYFLRKLGQNIDLTVFAKPCSTENLIEPDERKNYKYFESFSNKVLTKFGLQLNFKEWKLLQENWDIIILSWDLHHVLRYVYFILTRNKKKIIWMGHIYGTNSSRWMRILRKSLINKSAGVLTYSELIEQKLINDGIRVPVKSFNNSEVSETDIKILPFNFIERKLKMLYVGRYQERKRLDRLVDLAKRRKDVEIIIAGNNMENLVKVFPEIDNLTNLNIKGSVLGAELSAVMGWSDIIVNPGHLGLLVINGARFGRPIIIDEESKHAPEVIVAKEAMQFFVNWSDIKVVDEQIDSLINNRKLIIEASKRIVEIVRSKYTIEYMVQTFMEAINSNTNSIS